jgi:MFS family permease
MKDVIKPDEAVSGEIRKKNFRYVQIDAVGVGLASAAAPFLPVFLTRLEASNFQVGLLTTMPAVTGLFLALVAGRFLQTRRNIIPWFSVARLLVLSSYAMTGLAPFIVPREYVIVSVLMIWAVATLPQTTLAVAFSVVMNAVAGPQGRFDLLSRRWSTLGLTSSITVAVVGLVLDRISFPLNYQVVFLGLSLGGLLSFYFSSHIILPPAEPPAWVAEKQSLRQSLRNYIDLVRGEPAFVSFSVKRFVYLTGVALSAPLFPLYYVKEVKASNAWIGIISMTQTIVMMVGYFLWARLSRRRGSRFVLACTTAGMGIYPVLVAPPSSRWHKACSTFRRQCLLSSAHF